MKEKNTQRKRAKVKSTSEVYQGRIFNFVTEELTLPNGRHTEMAFIRHPGSIAVVPLLEDHSVVMELQYRHPVGEYLFEIPAGLLARDHRRNIVELDRVRHGQDRAGARAHPRARCVCSSWSVGRSTRSGS